MTVTKYDFEKPTPLPVDWHNRLTNWCRVALALANKSWAKQLPAPLEGSLQALDLCYARQALARLGDDSLAYRIKLGDRLVSVLILPRITMLNLVGIMLGDQSIAAGDREMTLIEEKLGDYFLINYWLAFFRESWPGAAGVAWMLEGREGNLPCSRIFAETDVLIAMNWQLRGSWGEAAGAWFIPRKGLMDLWGSHASSGPEILPEVLVSARREAIVQQLPVNVEIVLGSAEMQLSELSSLRVGDVVLLDQSASGGVLARSGGQDLFRGQAGRIGAWKAFQVETTVTK